VAKFGHVAGALVPDAGCDMAKPCLSAGLFEMRADPPTTVRHMGFCHFGDFMHRQEIHFRSR
jgi:hypothetical protein